MINKILAYIWLVGLFISPVFGQEFGSAMITSVPDSADVYIDGYCFGKTPFQPVNIIPGTYQIKLKHKGYDSLVTEMNIESGKRLVGKIELKKKEDAAGENSFKTDNTQEDRKKFKNLSESPKFISMQNPVYPQLAKNNGLEGKTYLHLLIDLDGTIKLVVIDKTSGSFCLDYEAIKTAYTGKFSPALDYENQPARVWIIYPIKFLMNR
ncbi:MAG: TonB family protein [Candidatus Edwardsbacteria bacterium]|nr:TonB family protein [Candidatus Edwardsbacteria bacterium]MBU1576923.1 TonB family protein [Candidatus Edwardsbacteria bacterium]MBU2463079.1 TonB family protein [Candidatus Edwardsbacteria bacterium]MBU2594285.1 TonB family protein [Candidatus Edwardsbacteria bacterium]